MALPKEFKPTSAVSRYLRLENGQNKFRVLSEMVYGWEGWTTEDGKKKPIRAKKFADLPDVVWDTEPKEFLAMVVWDRKAAEKKSAALTSEDKEINPLKILELTQKSVQKTIFNYENNEDWGDCRNYDMTITKTGEGMDTRYTLMASPHKDVTQDIKKAFEEDKINLQALFTGENPFKNDGAEERIDPEDLPF